MKVQARMEDKVRIENLKSLFAFFEKFGQDSTKIPERPIFGEIGTRLAW